MTDDELLRLACIYAEIDREAFLDAYEHCTDAEGRRQIRKTKAYLKRLRAYRLKRWGKTKIESLIESATDVVKPFERRNAESDE